MSFHEEVSRPLQTDGPAWYYENNPPVMKGFSEGLTSVEQDWGSEINGCRNH